MNFENSQNPDSAGSKEDIKKKRNELYAQARLGGNAYIRKLMHEIFVFCGGLKEKYADWNTYEYYHMLIASSNDLGEKFSKQDFPGEDSVGKFLDKLLAEFPEKKE